MAAPTAGSYVRLDVAHTCLGSRDTLVGPDALLAFRTNPLEVFEIEARLSRNYDHWVGRLSHAARHTFSESAQPCTRQFKSRLSSHYRANESARLRSVGWQVMHSLYPRPLRDWPKRSYYKVTALYPTTS